MKARAPRFTVCTVVGIAWSGDDAEAARREFDRHVSETAGVVVLSAAGVVRARRGGEGTALDGNPARGATTSR